jgi:hypothetical protein
VSAYPGLGGDGIETRQEAVGVVSVLVEYGQELVA